MQLKLISYNLLMNLTHFLKKKILPNKLFQEVMTSYVRSCSDEIGGFCDLSYLDESRCFLECSFALQTA